MRQEARPGVTDVPLGAHQPQCVGVVQAEVVVAVPPAAGLYLPREVLRRERRTIPPVDPIRVHLVANHDEPDPTSPGGLELSECLQGRAGCQLPGATLLRSAGGAVAALMRMALRRRAAAPDRRNRARVCSRG